MSAQLPSVDPASPWMTHLERAHGLAHQVARVIEDEPEPRAHLASAARELELGLVSMYDAFDGRADRVTAIGRAHTRLWAAAVLVARAGVPSGVEALREACGELISAEERFPRVPFAERATPAFRASADLPPLHAIERASLRPVFRAPPEPAPPPEVETALTLRAPKTFDELAVAAEAVRRLAKERGRPRPKRPASGSNGPPTADGWKEPAGAIEPPPKAIEPPPSAIDLPPGFAIALPSRMSRDEFVRRWARDCFEEIGMLGLQRAPMLGDDWRACRVLERRLLAAVDALAALGPTAVAHVERLAMDAPAANAMRVFAAAMIGGCVEGRDALAAAERVLFRFGPGDPLVAEAFVSAMKLAPNPFVPGALRTLLASSDPACRAIGAEVLAHRGWLTPADLDDLAEEDDAGVLAAALPALAIARHPALARGLARGLSHPELRVQEAALDAMALAAHRDAAAEARAAVEGSLGERALVRLAIVGGEDDARWLLERARVSPTVTAIEAVGWAGLVEAVPLLIELLGSAAGDEERLAAGAALERLLGARLIDTVEVEPEALDVDDVRLPEPELGSDSGDRARAQRRPLDELLSDPRDRAPAGSKERLEVPSIDAARWRAYWVENERLYDWKQRLRRGQRYSPSVSLYELDRLSLSAGDRRRLHRELAARTGRVARFEPHDFVAVQEAGLKEWEGMVREAGGGLGSWR